MKTNLNNKGGLVEKWYICQFELRLKVKRVGPFHFFSNIKP